MTAKGDADGYPMGPGGTDAGNPIDAPTVRAFPSSVGRGDECGPHGHGDVAAAFGSDGAGREGHAQVGSVTVLVGRSDPARDAALRAAGDERGGQRPKQVRRVLNRAQQRAVKVAKWHADRQDQKPPAEAASKAWDAARAAIEKIPPGATREYAWGLLATALQGAVTDIRSLRSSHANQDGAAALRAQARRAGAHAREDHHTQPHRKARI